MSDDPIPDVPELILAEPPPLPPDLSMSDAEATFLSSELFKSHRIALGETLGWTHYHENLWVPPGVVDFSELDCQPLPQFEELCAAVMSLPDSNVLMAEYLRRVGTLPAPSN